MSNPASRAEGRGLIVKGREKCILVHSRTAFVVQIHLFTGTLTVKSDSRKFSALASELGSSLALKSWSIFQNRLFNFYIS